MDSRVWQFSPIQKLLGAWDEIRQPVLPAQTNWVSGCANPSGQLFAGVGQPPGVIRRSKTMNLKPFEIQMTLPPPGADNNHPSGPRSVHYPIGAEDLSARETEPATSAKPAQPTHYPIGAEDLSTREPLPANGSEPAQSEPTIRRWIEELEEPVVVLDSGIIVETNSRAHALFRMQAGTMVKLHINKLVTEESLMRLADFLEFDDHEPAVVLGLRQDRRTFPLQLKSMASIICNGRRLRVTSLSRCAQAHDDPTPPRA
jgi:hypothetical protein